MRLIDADKLLRDIEHYHLSDGKFQHWVEIQPTIERKTGKWYKPNGVMPPEHFGRHRCSICDAFAMHDWKHHREQLTDYCPNCGADMRA